MYNKIIIILSLSILTFFILKKNNEQFVNFDSITEDNKQALDNLNHLVVSLYNKETETYYLPLNLTAITAKGENKIENKIEKLNNLYRNKYCSFCTEKANTFCNGCQTCANMYPLNTNDFDSNDITSSRSKLNDPQMYKALNCVANTESKNLQCLYEMGKCNSTLKHCKSLSFNELIASFDNTAEITLPKKTVTKYKKWFVSYKHPKIDYIKDFSSCVKYQWVPDSVYNKNKTRCKNNYKSKSNFQKLYGNTYDSGC
jgi:hypothetical protein